MQHLPTEIWEIILRLAVNDTSLDHLRWPMVCKKWRDACKQLTVSWNFTELKSVAQTKAVNPSPHSIFSVFKKVETLRFAPEVTGPLILTIALNFAEHIVTIDCRRLWSLRGKEWDDFIDLLHTHRKKFPNLQHVWNADCRLTWLDDGSWGKLMRRNALK